MMKVRLQLETLADIQEFVNIVSMLPHRVIVTDPIGHCVNAKSILGMLYSLEWSEIWCESAEDIYTKISKFVKV